MEEGARVPFWEELIPTPRVLRKSAQAIEDKEFGEENRVYGKWKSAQEHEPKGVTKLKRDPSSLRSSGLASFIGYSVVKERVRRAGQKQAFLRMLNRFMLRMLAQRYRYVKRYFYVLDEQGDVRGAADPSAQHCAEICKMRFRGARRQR